MKAASIAQADVEENARLILGAGSNLRENDSERPAVRRPFLEGPLGAGDQQSSVLFA